ncbi:hypothetical protein JZM25_23125 [Escherichia coli]|uniref:FaeA/PapI family transcriptional regulator n=1 Tax=Escherichia coli TaxID=562 RepID=UPI0019D0831B|nr:FaeA/PapI family transcriptional regulator [Escherichia coli]MBN6398164.1 hypothetical protein [Escherichia coli]
MKMQIYSFILNSSSPCQTTEIASSFALSSYQARHYLLCLEKEGKIRRTPPRRGTRTLWTPVTR